MERPDRGDPAIDCLEGSFFEAFCNGSDHPVQVVEDAADLPELALLEEHGGVRLGELTAQGRPRGKAYGAQ